MIHDCSILKESEITIVVNDMDWSDRVLLVSLPDLDVLLSAAIVTIKVHSWTVLE